MEQPEIPDVVEKTFASSASLSTELPALFFVPVA
jgi:hypothetical protein